MSNLELDNTDVVSMTANSSFTQTTTFQVTELRSAIEKHLGNLRDWFTYGVDCRVLRASGGGWQKGRLRLCLEFIPEKPALKPEPKPEPVNDDPNSLDSLRTELYPKQ